MELEGAGYEAVIVDNFSNSSRDVLGDIAKIAGKDPLFMKQTAPTITHLQKSLNSIRTYVRQYIFL